MKKKLKKNKKNKRLDAQCEIRDLCTFAGKGRIILLYF